MLEVDGPDCWEADVMVDPGETVVLIPEGVTKRPSWGIRLDPSFCFSELEECGIPLVLAVESEVIGDTL